MYCIWGYPWRQHRHCKGSRMLQHGRFPSYNSYFCSSYTGFLLLSMPNLKCWIWPLKPYMAWDEGIWRPSYHRNLWKAIKISCGRPCLGYLTIRKDLWEAGRVTFQSWNLSIGIPTLRRPARFWTWLFLERALKQNCSDGLYNVVSMIPKLLFYVCTVLKVTSLLYCLWFLYLRFYIFGSHFGHCFSFGKIKL